MTVMDYVNKFNHLVQYAGTHVDIDEKKRDHFYYGLYCILQKELYTRGYQTFSALMNAARSLACMVTEKSVESLVHSFG